VLLLLILLVCIAVRVGLWLVKAEQADLVESCSAMNMIPTIAVNEKGRQGEGTAGLSLV
jgi:hypothetical protein